MDMDIIRQAKFIPPTIYTLYPNQVIWTSRTTSLGIDSPFSLYMRDYAVQSIHVHVNDLWHRRRETERQSPD